MVTLTSGGNVVLVYRPQAMRRACLIRSRSAAATVPSRRSSAHAAMNQRPLRWLPKLTEVTTRNVPTRIYMGPDIPMRVIRRYVGEIARRFRPDRIVLFGSYAAGTPHEARDVDCWSSCRAAM